LRASQKGLVVDLEPLPDACYDYREWDKAAGRPISAKLNESGLDKLIDKRVFLQTEPFI